MEKDCRPEMQRKGEWLRNREVGKTEGEESELVGSKNRLQKREMREERKEQFREFQSREWRENSMEKEKPEPPKGPGTESPPAPHVYLPVGNFGLFPAQQVLEILSPNPE